MASENSVHVIKETRGWAVRREGSRRASSVHPTKSAAISAARKMAKVKSTKVVVHNQNGFLDKNERPVWQIAQEVSAQIPRKDWKKLPKDGAKNVDHYLYGLKKTIR